MGNCFGFKKNGDDDGSVENRLSETNEAATTKLASLTAQLQTLQDQRRRTTNEIRERKRENLATVRMIEQCIASKRPMPERCLSLHSELKLLADSLKSVNRSIAATQKFAQRLQAQRETVASLNDQHEQTTMFVNAQNAVESLGFTPDSVIRQQEELNSIVRNMDQLRDTVQFDVHESQISTSDGGGLSSIMDILAEVDEEDADQYLYETGSARKQMLTASVFGTSDGYEDLIGDDTVVELATTALQRPRQQQQTQPPQPPTTVSSMSQPRRRAPGVVVPPVGGSYFSNAKKAEIEALGN